jgi:hypothetical protein
VTAEDVSAFAAPVLRHRLQRNYLAESDDVGVEEIVAAIVAAVAP